MFQNRIHALGPGAVNPPFNPGVLPTNRPNPPVTPMAVQLNDIYKAAAQRAIEEHEIDKLFNAEFYDDYQI